MTEPAPHAPTPALSANERLILDVVRRKPSIPRSAITAETPFSQPWVNRLVNDLLARGWLVSGEPLKGVRGQPSVTISLARQAAYAIGIAVETDSVSVCLSDLCCDVVEAVDLPGLPLERQPTLAAIAAAVDTLLAKHGVPRERVVGAGLSITGFFVAGRQINAPLPLSDWSLVDLEPLVSDALQVPVSVLNNATAAAIGEALVGVGRWARSFCYLSFSYGFGSGLVIDGRPYFGRNGNAGEMSGFAPGRETEERPALQYLLAELQQQGVGVASVADIQRRFDPNWPGVDAWAARVRPQLDRVVNTVAGLFDLDALVFGGALPQTLGLQLIGQTEFWGGHRYDAPPPRPRLVLSEAGSRAALLGASLQALSARFFT